MALESDFLKQLVATFKTELDEKLEIISTGLLALEKNKKKNAIGQIIEPIFRSAHNIKGSAQSIGITNVSKIAHQIESLFSSIQEKNTIITPDIINLCLLAVDSMHSAMKSYCNNEPLNFDLEMLIKHLQHGIPLQSNSIQLEKLPIEENVVSSELKEYEAIKVPLKQINVVSSLVEQLQSNKISMEEHFTELGKINALIKTLLPTNSIHFEPFKEINQLLNHLHKEMHNHTKELNLITNSLQEEVRMLRLVPVSGLLHHLTRSIRDIAQELGKKIELHVTGDGVRMDKVILEKLRDPIIHLLRNAIDHGIESSEVRKNMGKPEYGTINIDVIDKGNQIVIDVNDDGMGINYKTVASNALKKNIVKSSELDSMDEQSILELIFRPEFSTKELITDISGRGVGLDAVKSNLEELNGTVSFKTELGQGTRFLLHLPLTLSSDIGLIIQSAGQLFGIPISAVDRVMMLDINDIHEVETSQVLLIDHKPVSLHTLADTLNLEKPELPLKNILPIVLLKKGRDQVALLVDEIIGERDIVIKSLNPPLNYVPCVAGGTLLGTGEVIIVLNPGDIINYALYSGRNSRIDLQANNNSTKIPHILLVDDSITTRTLEKNILENNNYQVTATVDGKEAWALLQKQDFSLVITDIEMPHINGFELTERIKQHGALSSIPVIIVTSLSTDDQKKRGIEVGADAYIVKHDFDSTELLNVVRQLV